MTSDSKKKEKKKTADSALGDRVLVDKQGLAAALSISLPTVSVRIREGMPCVQEGGRGRAWQFDLAECVKWHTDRAVSQAFGVTEDGLSKSELEKAMMVEDLKIKRVNSAKALNEVCLLDEVRRGLESTFITVRQTMMTIPDRTALRLLAAESETDIKQILITEIDLALTELSESEIIEDSFDAISE